MRVLQLIVDKRNFEVISSGEKTHEYLFNSKTVEGKLYDSYGQKRSYDLIKVVNGIGLDRPFLICKWEGFLMVTLMRFYREYSNGFEVYCELGDYELELGEIIEKEI